MNYWCDDCYEVILALEKGEFVDAPVDGQTYGRRNAMWVVLAGGGVTVGNLIEAISNVLAITGGTGAVVGAGTTIQVKQAGTSQDGFLTATDWNTFNNKQGALAFGNLTEVTSAILSIAGGTGSQHGAGTTIAVQKADATHDGYLSSVDWNRFNTGGGSITTGNLTEATSAVLAIVGGTGAVVGTGTTIQVKQAGATQSGYLSSTDWNRFNSGISGTLGNLTEATSSVLTITGGTGAVVGAGTTIAVKQASASQAGYLSSADWNTFNNKQSALTFGNLTETTSAILTITGGTGSQHGTGTTIAVQQADSTHNGYLSSTDWNRFNSGISGTTGNLTEAVSAVLTIVGGTGAVVGAGTSIQVTLADATHSGYLSAADWNRFNTGSAGGGASKGLIIAFVGGFAAT